MLDVVFIDQSNNTNSIPVSEKIWKELANNNFDKLITITKKLNIEGEYHLVVVTELNKQHREYLGAVITRTLKENIKLKNILLELSLNIFDENNIYISMK